MLKGEERERFVEQINPQLVALKKYNYSKQIASIEKLLPVPQGHHQSQSSSSHNEASSQSPRSSKAMPLEIKSSTTTPPSTYGQNSPQSGSLPSTIASSVVDGTAEASASLKDEIQKTAPAQQAPDIQVEPVAV